MRNALRRARGGLNVFGFWAVVLLVLPGCRQILGIEDPILAPHANLQPGARPHSAVIFCDIEKALGRHCATSLDKAIGIRLSEAAVALADGRTSNIGLDDSAEARARCGGEPEAVLFEGPFPSGMPVCLNCGTIAANFGGDTNAACRARCYDLYGSTREEGSFLPDVPPDPVVRDFCDVRARVSTNFPTTQCYDGACSDDGIFADGAFSDPRRFPDPVAWVDGVGVALSGLDLIRMSPLSAGAAGAASEQWILRGDAHVDFGVTRAHRLGFSEGTPPGCTACPDNDPGTGDITFGIDVAADGRIGIFERGVRIAGPNPGGFFGATVPTERLRVHVRDNGDGGATISYARVAACLPGAPCPTAALYTSFGRARYPLRVDVSIFQVGASVLDARLVYIK